MYAISDDFKSIARENSRYVDVKCNIGGIDYTDIIEFSISKSVSNEDEFQVGVLVASRLNIKIRNAKNILSHSLCIPFVRFSTDLGVTYTEWCPLGNYYVDNRYYNDGIVSITAYDKVLYLDNIYDSKLEYPATFKDVLDEISANSGFEYDIELDEIILNYKPVNYTEREIIQFCASCHAGVPFFDNNGVLKFNYYSLVDESLDITNAIEQSIDDQAYTIRKIDCVQNKVNTFSIGKSDGDYSTVSFSNPFITQEQFERRYSPLLGFRYYKSTITKTSFGYYETGDSFNCFDTSDKSNQAQIIISSIEITFSSGELFKEVISSNARNPSDDDYVKTSDIESAIRNETEELQDAVYYFENEGILNINDSKTEIIRIRFTSKTQSTPLFHANIIFLIETPGLLEFEYVIDNTKYRIEPKHNVIEGYTTLHLFLPLFQMKGNQAHEIVVYVMSGDAIGIINRNQIQCTVNGQGLEVVGNDWDGTIQVITEVPPTLININNLKVGVDKIATSLDLSNKTPESSMFVTNVANTVIDLSNSINIGIGSISSNLAFARVIVDEQINFNYLTKQLFVYDTKYIDYRENDMSMKTEYIFDQAIELEIDNGRLQELSLDLEQFKQVEQIMLEVE